jgi:hypothetical protein
LLAAAFFVLCGVAALFIERRGRQYFTTAKSKEARRKQMGLLARLKLNALTFSGGLIVY